MKIDISKPYAISYPSPTMETVIEKFFLVVLFYSSINLFYDNEDTEKGAIEFINKGMYNLLGLKRNFIYKVQGMDVIQHCMMAKSTSIYGLVKAFSRNFNPSNRVYLFKYKGITKILLRVNHEDIQNKW